MLSCADKVLHQRLSGLSVIGDKHAAQGWVGTERIRPEALLLPLPGHLLRDDTPILGGVELPLCSGRHVDPELCLHGLPPVIMPVLQLRVKGFKNFMGGRQRTGVNRAAGIVTMFSEQLDYPVGLLKQQVGF